MTVLTRPPVAGKVAAAGPAAVAAPKTVRVLVVDDSAYMRFAISKALSESPGLEVIGAAPDGQEALRLIPQLRPDVVTLDVEMPRLDGLSALREIMARHPLPVVMLSSLTVEGARETVQALTLGAVDFVGKPTAKANIAAVMDEVSGKVRAAAGARVTQLRPRATEAPGTRAAPARPAKTTRPLRAGDKVVVIGSSTGGPRALQTVVSSLAADWPAAFFIVQHMPVGFTRSLAERLDSLSPLAIKEAEPGDAPEVGRALVAPGGFHMTLDGQGRVSLNQNPTMHGVRPAIDVTLSAVAQRYKSAAVAVVLTGMGRDGTQGASLVRAAGGRVIAEDESTCVVWGMPRSVMEAGVADDVTPLPEVAHLIGRAVNPS
jgi:two-component system chemotaxis response regulator CheB